MDRRMGVAAFNLQKAFGTNGLRAAPREVDILWIIQKANGALNGVSVQKDF